MSCMFVVWQVIVLGLSLPASFIDKRTEESVALGGRNARLLFFRDLMQHHVCVGDAPRLPTAAYSETVRRDVEFLNSFDFVKFAREGGSVLSLPSKNTVLFNASRLKAKHYSKFKAMRSALAVFLNESTALNWILHSEACGYDLELVLPYVGVDWYAQLKALSNLVAITLDNDHGLACLLELHVLKGFTKDKDFDLLAEAKEFAQPEQKLTTSAEDLWALQFDRLRPNPDYKPLSQFVLEGGWQTSGSAGNKYNFVITENGKRRKVKCLKDMLIDQLSLEEILGMAAKPGDFEDVAIVKEEITKSRLAVASDLRWYFVSAWLSSMFDKWMKTLDGVIGNESPDDADSRVKLILEKLKGRWGLSFDYKKFDHQITQKILLHVIDGLIKSLDVYLSDFEKLCLRNLREALTRRVLIVRAKDKEIRLTCTGSLPSGWAFTTKMANLFSWCLIASFGESLPRWIKGDDALLVVESQAVGEKFLKHMADLGVQFSTAKSFLKPEAGQLLRVFYDAGTKTTATAIVARSAGAAHQAKPWLTADFKTDLPLAVSAKACGVTFARAGRLSFVQAFSKSLKLPIGCGVSLAYGGLGWFSNRTVRAMVLAEPDHASVYPPRNFSFQWRSKLIATTVGVTPDIYTEVLAADQWEKMFLEPDKLSHADLTTWVPDSLVFSGGVRILPPLDLSIRYLMLKANVTRNQAIRALSPNFYAERYKLRRWGYKIAEKYLASGFELSSLIPDSIRAQPFRTWIKRIFPSHEPDYFKSVFDASFELLKLWELEGHVFPQDV